MFSNISDTFSLDFTLKSTLPDLSRFPATESPLKLMKNTFHFISKALFVLKIYTFLSWLFCHAEDSLIRRLRLTSKFMTSSTVWQITTHKWKQVHIFCNISRSKSNHTIKFDQLIQYNLINIFLEISYTK